jgi:hypothetical protein
MSPKIELDDKPHTLAEVAAHLEPAAFGEWRSAVEDRRKNSGPPSSWERSEFATHLADLRYGTQHSEMTRQERRFNDLLNRLIGVVRAVIGSPLHVTEGMNAGAWVPVLRVLSPQLKIDLENNTLALKGGGEIWSGVIVRRAQDAVAKSWRDTRTAGVKRDTREGMKAFVIETYPDGIPASVKNELLLEQARTKKVKGSDRTLRRVLKELRDEAEKEGGQNPAK